MMNSVFRFLMLGALAMTFTVVSFAQDPCTDYDGQKALYDKFTAAYSGTTLESQQTALSSAKDFVGKYGACGTAKQQADYFNGYIPSQEERVKKMIAAANTAALYKRFNDAQAAKNWDEFYAAGKDIIAQEPDSDTAFDITIALGSVGLDQAAAGNNKYNADTIKYAQTAIDKINAGKSSKNFGVPSKSPDSNFAYKNDKFPDTKSNALGWLNYNIAYLKYYVDKSDAAKKEAIPYFYKVTQLNSIKKNKAEVYYAIGTMYNTELFRLEDDRQAKLKAANPDEKDQKKWKDTDDTKQIFALEKGYADRVLDAYSRVYNTFPVAPTDPKDKANKDQTYNDLKTVYAFRYQGKQNALDALIASTKSTPLPDPSTPVTPVVEVEPTPATTTTTGTTATPGAATAPTATPATTTKPAATTTTTAKPATTTTPATTPKPSTATKPAPKKTNPKR